MCVSNICHESENGLEMLQSSHMWWRAHCIWDMTLSHVTKVEKIKTRLGSMDRLQVWRASRRLWSEGPRVTVKLEQDLAPMDRCNGEEQVRSRSMRVMIWSGSYHLWLVGACVASTLEEMEWNAQGKGVFVGHFISPVKGCVEKYMAILLRGANLFAYRSFNSTWMI